MKEYRDSSVFYSIFYFHLKISKQNGIKGFEFSVHKVKVLIELPLHLEQSARGQPKWKWICLKKSICLLQNGIFERLAKCSH